MIYKRREYFSAGTEQVWVVDLDKQVIEVFFPDARKLIVGSGALEGEGIVTGLTLDVGAVFRPLKP